MPHHLARAKLLTIGMPVYNAMPYLPEAVESLRAQTMPEFRVLAIVDGATDGSLEYLRSLNDPRFEVIEQPQSGVARTLNRMLAEAKTPWLVRQDADDLSTPNRLEVICEAIEQHPDAGMFYSHAAYYPAGRSVGLFRSTRGGPEQIRALARSGYVPAICHPSATLSVPKMQALGGYREGLQCEDADLWWRMALAYDVRFVPQVLLHFRQNAGSLSSRNHRQQALHGLYVQYLLLSRLEGRQAAELPEVEQELDGMLDDAPLRAKEALRLCNISLGQGKAVRALGHLAASVSRSPGYFFKRLCDEWFPGSIGNGVAPKLYRQRKERLWPSNLAPQAARR